MKSMGVPSMGRRECIYRVTGLSYQAIDDLIADKMVRVRSIKHLDHLIPISIRLH